MPPLQEISQRVFFILWHGDRRSLLLSVLTSLVGGLIVSCQALEHEPLHGPWLMAGMAWAAKIGGAAGIRANGAQDIAVIKETTQLPVIGIEKQEDAQGRLCITPDFAAARRVAQAGADIVAVDCRHNRPFGEDLAQLIPRIKEELDLLVMADIATVDEGKDAEELDVDLVATTFAFKEGSYGSEPDFPLIEQLTKSLSVPVIAEGGFWTPEQVVTALDLGVLAVVVGTAITRPQDITRRFVQAMKSRG